MKFLQALTQPILFLTLIFLNSSNLKSQHISTTIQFKTNQYNLTTVAQSKLAKTLNSIPLQKIVRIALIGHTDSDGDIAYNQKLSERRSQATLNYLVNFGINKNLVEVYSKGEVEPKADNATKGGKAINRRVELTIVYQVN